MPGALKAQTGMLPEVLHTRAVLQALEQENKAQLQQLMEDDADPAPYELIDNWLALQQDRGEYKGLVALYYGQKAQGHYGRALLLMADEETPQLMTMNVFFKPESFAVRKVLFAPYEPRDEGPQIPASMRTRMLRHAGKQLPPNVQRVKIEQESGAAALPGMLQLPPETEGPVPVVVLLPGIGTTPAKGSLGMQAPHAALAAQLAEQGIATLRFASYAYADPMHFVGHPERQTPQELFYKPGAAALHNLLKFKDQLDLEQVFVAGYGSVPLFFGKLDEQINQASRVKAAGYVAMAPGSDGFARQLRYRLMRQHRQTKEWISFSKPYLQRHFKTLQQLEENPRQTIERRDIAPMGIPRDFWQEVAPLQYEEGMASLAQPLLWVLAGGRAEELGPRGDTMERLQEGAIGELLRVKRVKNVTPWLYVRGEPSAGIHPGVVTSIRQRIEAAAAPSSQATEDER
jgi:dienelactone hydrolase